MTTVVVPFAGRVGKTRLHPDASVRAALSRAMLDDVLAVCAEIGAVRLATTPGGQGHAVASALRDIAGPVLIVNADLPCATPDALAALRDAGTAIVEAADGTTNALSLSDAASFASLYGPGSAARFRAHLGAVTLDLPALKDDVDTFDDLVRLQHTCGPRTRAALAALRIEATA